MREMSFVQDFGFLCGSIFSDLIGILSPYDFRNVDIIMNKTPLRAYPWDAQTVNTKCPVTVNYNYG